MKRQCGQYLCARFDTAAQAAVAEQALDAQHIECECIGPTPCGYIRKQNKKWFTWLLLQSGLLFFTGLLGVLYFAEQWELLLPFAVLCGLLLAGAGVLVRMIVALGLFKSNDPLAKLAPVLGITQANWIVVTPWVDVIQAAELEGLFRECQAYRINIVEMEPRDFHSIFSKKRLLIFGIALVVVFAAFGLLTAKSKMEHWLTPVSKMATVQWEIPAATVLFWDSTAHAMDYGDGHGRGVMQNRMAQSAESDSALYSIFCSICHGNTGLGNLEWEDTYVMPTPWESIPWTDSLELAWEQTILNGSGYMPAFSDRLTAKEVVRIIQYIKSITSEQVQGEP
jgi:hypothetical protein